MVKLIENFADPNENYGKKGNNLKILMELFDSREKILIPETLILPVSIYKKVLSENEDVDLSKYENIYINPEIRKDILTFIRAKFDNSRLVVRSSATCEDSIFFSGSGQYDSFLNIDSDEKIIDAIRRIYASLHKKNSKIYSDIYNIKLNNEGMAILVQKVAPVVKAGVMFSCDPVNMKKKYIIESTKGLGTNVVEGVGNINHLEIDYSDKKNITDFEIRKLIEAIDVIKEKYGYNVDVEWGIDKEDNLYIFQVRPIIYRDIPFDIKYDPSLVSQKCNVISRGFSIGKIENITDVSDNSILFQNEKYNFNNMELLLKSRGVILKENSKLSHFANILREIVKPCVYIENFKPLQDNLYAIDAFNGNIINFNELETKNKIKLMFDYFNYMKVVLNLSYEKYNGILDIEKDDKLEEVIFDVNIDDIIEKLVRNGFKKTQIEQKIYTYDFSDRSLISNNAIFRIQVSNEKTNVQFKLLDSSNNNYRKEEGVLIYFDSLENAKKFMKSYSMLETGYQERKIIKFEKEGIILNVIIWPNSQPYLGIEAKNYNELKQINEELNLEKCEIASYGGKQIFKKLNLSLNNCKFDRGNEK